MLRVLVLLLLLANAAYYGWSQGALSAWGWGPAETGEPQRVEQQVNADALRILPPDEARKAELAAITPPRPPECLLAGPLGVAQAEDLRRQLASWPAGSWALEETVDPARWIIYMGKFPNTQALDHKREELDRMKIKVTVVDVADLQPGISLGRYENLPQAQAELGNLQKRGVRTARVVQERAEARQTQLRLPAVDDALRGRLDGLRSSLGDRTLHACR